MTMMTRTTTFDLPPLNETTFGERIREWSQPMERRPLPLGQYLTSRGYASEASRLSVACESSSESSHTNKTRCSHAVFFIRPVCCCDGL